MSDPHSTRDESKLDETAANWLFEREEGFTAERAKAFAEWCARDARHARAVARVEQTLALLNELPAVRAPLEARLANSRTEIDTARTKGMPRIARLICLGGLAAALLVGVAVWRMPAPHAEFEQHYATDTAAERSLSLPDNSVIDLNTGSELSVHFTAHERRVTLEKGEAHFQVAHDVTRPFTVTAGDVTVRAVGTAFDVRLATETVAVAVVEGKVQLGRSGGASGSDTAAGNRPLLKAGEIAQMTRSDRSVTPQIEPIDSSALRALLTWQNPMTSFTDVPLRDVVVRFNRRNATLLVLEDAELGERKIGGVFALDKVDAFVRLLEQDGDMVADRQVAGRISLRRAR